MAEVVNRNGFPKSGIFLSFLKMFVSLDPSQRKNVFINHSETPGIFNYCVFPSTITPGPRRSAQRLPVVVAVVDDEQFATADADSLWHAGGDLPVSKQGNNLYHWMPIMAHTSSALEGPEGRVSDI
jgi:hypothetical protein